MNLTRKERLELCEMSENSFGGRYDWLKYLNTPAYEKEYDAINSRFVKVAKWRTFEEVKAMMTGEVKTEVVPATEEVVS